jgi:hypothetical protein
VELLVAALLTSVVILVAWSGLIAVMNMSQAAEARTARQAEVYKALDFMTNEIRMARSINATETLKADGTTVSVADVVTSSGLNLASLGSYGTVSLYLERPTSDDVPAICPAGGPNAGAAPPAPVDYDRIVYDIRPSPSSWLSPRILMRYGRVPMADGSINPCSSPIANDPMVDALSATATPPNCSGVLSGNGGFYACVQGNQTDLYFQSDITKTETKRVSSTASSRIGQLPGSPDLTLTGTRPSGDNLNFSWAWSNGGTATSYELFRIWDDDDDDDGDLYKPYTGTATSFDYTLSYAEPGDNVCFYVKAQTATGPIESNQKCFTK